MSRIINIKNTRQAIIFNAESHKGHNSSATIFYDNLHGIEKKQLTDQPEKNRIILHYKNFERDNVIITVWISCPKKLQRIYDSLASLGLPNAPNNLCWEIDYYTIS